MVSMTPPETALRAFLVSVAIGGLAGLGTDVLDRPRQRFGILADCVLSIWLVWLWAVLYFDVCSGDLRMGFCASAFAGAVL